MLQGAAPTSTESLRDRLTREQENHANRKASHENAKREAQERDREDYEEYIRWASHEQEHAKREQDRTDVLDASRIIGRTGVPETQTTVVYRLYTEYKAGIPELVSRYFAGATIYDAIGLWHGAVELACIIEIVGTHADLQSIAHLVGDIKVQNRQSSVLVTRQSVDVLPLGE